jgi:transcriptional regulator with XRE-family HTH domain
MEIRSVKQLGAALRGTRVAQDLSVEDLAGMMATSHAFLRRLEQGKATAAIQKLFTALNELGIAMHLELPPQAAGVRIESDPEAPVKRSRVRR